MSGKLKPVEEVAREVQRAGDCGCPFDCECSAIEHVSRLIQSDRKEACAPLVEAARELADKVGKIGECDHPRRSCASVGCIGAEVKAVRAALAQARKDGRA